MKIIKYLICAVTNKVTLIGILLLTTGFILTYLSYPFKYLAPLFQIGSFGFAITFFGFHSYYVFLKVENVIQKHGKRAGILLKRKHRTYCGHSGIDAAVFYYRVKSVLKI